MNISQWKNNASLNVVKHRPELEHDQRDFEQRLADNQKVEGRLQKLRSMVKPLAMVSALTAMSALGTGCSSMQMSQEDFSQAAMKVVAEEQRLDAAGLRDLLDDDHQHFQEIAGSDMVTIVDRNDPNIISVISRAQDHLIPGASEAPSDLRNQIRHSIASMVGSISTQAAAVRMGAPEHGEALCFIQAEGPESHKLNYTTPVFLADDEAKLFVASHELAHCQDGRILADDNELILKKEILADMTSGLLVASHTGNWDLTNNMIIPMRILNIRDKDHATAPWLQEMMRTTDASELEPMSQREAFDMALEKLETMDHQALTKENTRIRLLSQHFRHFGDPESDWRRMNLRDQKEFKDELGVDGPEQFGEAMKEAAQLMIGTYARHIDYKGAADNPVVYEPLQDMIVRYAYGFDDKDAFAVSKGIHQDKLEGAKMDLAKIMEVMDIDAPLNGPERLESNQEKIEKIADAFLGNGPIPDQFTTKFGENLVQAPSMTSSDAVTASVLEKIKEKNRTLAAQGLHP